MHITIETTVHAPLTRVWAAWNDPRAIEQWNAASPDWHTPRASVDLREGGRFCSRMEAKDGSAGFDFEGTYTQIEAERLIEYATSDGRQVRVEFIPAGEGVTVRETFDAEDMHSAEQQRQGWQAILDNFAHHVEAGMRQTPEAERTLFTCRVLPVQRADVWAAFADPTRLAQWWGPNGFRNTFHHFDFSPGGLWLHTLHGPDGRDYANESRFVELVPGERLVMEHLSAPWFRFTLTLADQDGGTRVSWAQTFADAETCAHLAPICSPSNEQNLDRLAAVVRETRALNGEVAAQNG